MSNVLSMAAVRQNLVGARKIKDGLKASETAGFVSIQQTNELISALLQFRQDASLPTTFGLNLLEDAFAAGSTMVEGMRKLESVHLECRRIGPAIGIAPTATGDTSDCPLDKSFASGEGASRSTS